MGKLTAEKVHLKDKEIKRIYCDAFPKEERMAFPLMVAMSKLWNTDFLAFYEDGCPIGLVYLAKNRRLVFVMFLAVTTEKRSQGYGSQILSYLREQYSQKIVISIEPCVQNASDLSVRQKRKKFYLKNGYEKTGYYMKLNGIEQEVIISGGDFKKQEFLAFFILYSNATVWPKVWKKDPDS